MSALFFFNDTATTEIYTLSLHDALPICGQEDDAVHLREATGVERDARVVELEEALLERRKERPEEVALRVDRKSTRLNSSHANISYAVFCLKKKTYPVCERRYMSGRAAR